MISIETLNKNTVIVAEQISYTHDPGLQGGSAIAGVTA
jgi:hypothetical protein